MINEFSNIKRCAKCILPSTMPGIKFDKEGVCNYCNSYIKQKLLGEDSLLKILATAQKTNSEYDCIVNISGGRDSSYAILKLVKDYQMKVLAVNYQNPFTHPIALQNIENIQRILGVKLISFSFKPGFHQKVLSYNLQALLKKTDPAMVPMVCISCKLIWKDILSIARRYKIRLIVSGGNLYEATAFKRILLGGTQNQSMNAYYSRYIWGLTGRTIANFRFLRPQTLWPTIQGYLYSNPYSPMVRLRGRDIEKLDLFHYLPWDEHEVVGRIQTELGWQYPSGNQSSWRFDCQIGHLKDYLYLKTLGMTEKDDFYSKLIREDKISREGALQRIEKENRINYEEINRLLKAINFDTSSTPYFKEII
jgi:hypothetical protein